MMSAVTSCSSRCGAVESVVRCETELGCEGSLSRVDSFPIEFVVPVFFLS